jgi:hypothetical protein
VPSEYQTSPRSGANAGCDIAQLARSSMIGPPVALTDDGGAM